MDNMRLYNAFKDTPKEAQKTIGAGKLKGMTDINPMWRIKKLTEQFGPQGEGWKLDVIDMKMFEAGGESMAHVVLALTWRKEDGSWSEPIFGVGGSKLAGKGVGDGINDEAFKMAFTDAMSICCKGLGMSADIYYQKDRTKYTAETADDDFDAEKEAIKKKIMSCQSKEELIRVYNDDFGGNAKASKFVKQLTQAKLTEFTNG